MGLILITSSLKSDFVYANEKIYVKNLQSAEYLDFFEAFHDEDLIMLFQPDCSACKAQARDLKCLPHIKFLGTNGSEQRLVEELVKFKAPAPAFSIDLKTLKKLNPKLQIVTPQFFKVSKTKNQNLVLKNLGVGLKTCQSLKTI